jgi:hypothetical protein
VERAGDLEVVHERAAADKERQVLAARQRLPDPASFHSRFDSHTPHSRRTSGRFAAFLDNAFRMAAITVARALFRFPVAVA